MNNLYLDTTELRQQIDALLLQYPELLDDDILRTDMFEAETNLDVVLEKLIDKARTAAMDVEGMQKRIVELGIRKTRFERQEEVMRNLIQKIMERANLSKKQLSEATLSLSWRKPVPFVTDETQVPDEYCKVRRSPDLAKIKEAETLPPGCSMTNGKNVLTVRVK